MLDCEIVLMDGVCFAPLDTISVFFEAWRARQREPPCRNLLGGCRMPVVFEAG
jgi:hypothetical protein